jgi:hypothetical protein
VQEFRDKQPPHVFVLLPIQREKVKSKDLSWVRTDASGTLCCWQVVWDEGAPNFDKSQLYDIMLRDNRKGFCFPCHQGMLLPATKELQYRDSERAKTNKEHWFAISGLWIASMAFLAQVIFSVLNFIKKP